VGVREAAHSEDGHGLEFLMSAPHRTDRIVELLTIAAYYHCGPLNQRLDLGHTSPIGEPWLPGSACDHFLVSLPYPYGPDLEWCEWPEGRAQHLWLLPITRAERDLKVSEGLEALEDRLDRAAVDPTDPKRRSVA
jgi:hypothetical protein